MFAYQEVFEKKMSTNEKPPALFSEGSRIIKDAVQTLGMLERRKRSRSVLHPADIQQADKVEM